MKKIPLTRGKFAIVDDEDYERLSSLNWYAAKQPNTFYAARTEKVGGKKVNVWMHRLVNETPDGMKTDHIDGDGLNNTRTNLRSVSHQDNMINSARWKEKKPKYRGVSWHKNMSKWIAQITVDYKNIYIGSFDTPEEAKRAYDLRRNVVRANKIYRGE